MPYPIKVVFVKIGFLGSTLLPESLLDERASRKDIVIRSLATGTSMKREDAVDVAERAASYAPHLVVLVAPALSQEGPQAALDIFTKTKLRVVAVTDTSSKKALEDLEKKGVGYVLLEADSLIGARREYLDPVETAIFNSDLLKVLAVTGACRLIQEELDRVLDDLKGEKPVDLPKLVVDAETAVRYSGLSNPYAKAKALASYVLASAAGSLSFQGCYKVKERERYLPLVASAHEVMRTAAHLADEAREIEKGKDSVLRRMHLEDGSVKQKRSLFDPLT